MNTEDGQNKPHTADRGSRIVLLPRVPRRTGHILGIARVAAAAAIVAGGMTLIMGIWVR